MIEQNAAARVHVVGFAEVHRDPVRINLGASIRTARVKRRQFSLGRLAHLTEHLTGRRLIITRLHARRPNRLQVHQPKVLASLNKKYCTIVRVLYWVKISEN